MTGDVQRPARAKKRHHAVCPQKRKQYPKGATCRLRASTIHQLVEKIVGK